MPILASGVLPTDRHWRQRRPQAQRGGDPERGIASAALTRAMGITRRTLLSRMAAAAATGAAFQAVSDLAFAEAFPAPSASSSAEPIVLSRNENAYGPSEKVFSAMREALSGSNRYPRAGSEFLANQIARIKLVNQ